MNGPSVAVRVCPTTGSSGTQTTGAWLVRAPRAHAEALREEIAGVLSAMGLRLSPEKTLITHIDEGLDLPRLAHPAPPQARHRQAATSTSTRPRRRCRPSWPR